MGTISLVLTARNRAPQLGRTLASLEAHDYTDVEVVVLDDGSTDETREIVEKHPHVIYHRREGGHWKVNPAGPINEAVALSSGEIVVKACAEVAHLTPVVLELAGEVAPGRAAFATVVNLRGEDLARIPRPLPVDPRRLVHRDGPDAIFDESCPVWQAGDVRGDLFIGIDRPFPLFFCGAILRDDWDRLGGYDPALERAADIDLWRRMVRLGFEFAFVGPALAVHQRHGKT